MHPDSTLPPDGRRDLPSLRPPPSIALERSLVEQWTDLTAADRRVLTGEVLERWTADLHPDDIDLRAVATRERRRLVALQTLRSEAGLTTRELQLVRYLQRYEGRTCTYLMIARHLFSTPQQTVTAALLRAHHGYAAPMIAHIHVMVAAIRRKLEIDFRRPQHLATIWAVGYRWYSAPPSTDDGEDYDAREAQAIRQREELFLQLGLVEGDFTVIEGPLDRDGEPYETRLALGPEHRDYDGGPRDE